MFNLTFPKILLLMLVIGTAAACTSGNQEPLEKVYSVEELLGPDIYPYSTNSGAINLVVNKPDPYEITLTGNSIFLNDITHSFDASIVEATSTALSTSFEFIDDEPMPQVVVDYNELDIYISCRSGSCSSSVSFGASLTVVVPGRTPNTAIYVGDHIESCQGTWGCPVDNIHPIAVKRAFAELINLLSFAIITEIENPN